MADKDVNELIDELVEQYKDGLITRIEMRDRFIEKCIRGIPENEVKREADCWADAVDEMLLAEQQ